MHQRLRKILKTFMILLIVGMVVVTLPRLGSAFVYNLIIVLSGVVTPGNTIGSIWYGMGSHKDADTASLTEWIISHGMGQEACHDQEHFVLGVYTRLPFVSLLTSRASEEMLSCVPVMTFARGALSTICRDLRE